MSYTFATSGPPTRLVPPIDASIMCVPTSDGTNSMRIAPFADSCVIRAATLALLGANTFATQSFRTSELPGGGNICGKTGSSNDLRACL